MGGTVADPDPRREPARRAARWRWRCGGPRIDLGPLSDADIETLVDAAVEAVGPAGLLGNVREHAAGVPSFAVESLRMLADRGVMVAKGAAQRYRLVGEVEDLDVPPSIHALIAARLDGLGDSSAVCCAEARSSASGHRAAGCRRAGGRRRHRRSVAAGAGSSQSSF